MNSMEGGSFRRYPFNVPQEGLKLLSHCPVCQHRYNPFTAHVVEERDGAQLVHVTCNQCSSSIVALVLSGGFGVSSVGFITDLSSDDVLRLKHSETVTSDDVLTLYKELDSNQHWIEEL